MDGTRRLTLRGASEELGVSVEAVRKRVKRGSLRSEKGPDGRVYVYLDAGVYPSPPDREEGGELVEALRDQIEYLQRQVEEEREARRRADVMLSRLMDRLPELEAPQEGRQEPAGGQERAPEGQDASGTHPDRQEPTQRQETRPWWRRLLGG